MVNLSSLKSIKTPLGDLQISVQAVGGRGDVDAIANCVQVFPFNPDIPPGMSVSGCVAAVASISPGETLRNVLFRARLDASEEVESGLETGQGLEAQSFRSARHVVLVGTEDADYLKARLKGNVQLPEDPYTYTDDSISVQLSEVAAGETISLHFVVAWNDLPEPQDCSCWYAVDQRHSALLSALALRQC